MAASAAVVALLVAYSIVVTFLARRARAQLGLARVRARVAREREAAFVERSRRLGNAALRSTAEVRVEIDAAVRALAPAIDCVLVFDADGTDLTCTFAGGARVAYFAGTRIARADEALLPARALLSGRREERGPGRRSFHPADAFALAVPLPREDGTASVLYVAATTALDAGVADAIVTLAEQAAFAYAFARDRETDRRRAEYDPLTGLLTPRAFRDRLTTLLDRARGAPLARVALLFVDTDRFKAWNDTCGHASGDALLRAIAQSLRAAAGAGDLAARNGGDEFCVVLAETEKSGAVARADALRSSIAALDFAALRPAGASDDVCVTASIGVAAYPADATSAHDLLERADAAMYHTKRSGRDGVSYYVDGALVRAEGATP